MKIDLYLAILILPIAVISFSNNASATPTMWSEVTSPILGAGTQNITTDHFTCNHSEWRIRWEFSTDYPPEVLFSVHTYPRGEDVLFIDSIVKMVDVESVGTSYIHNKTGTFYMKINTVYCWSYTIIVEEDLHSIPEFSPILILPLSMIAVLLAFTIYRRRKHC